jgi:hypothetical protein
MTLNREDDPQRRLGERQAERSASSSNNYSNNLTDQRKKERVTGIEPALSAWEADVLPLNYTRALAAVAHT